MRTMYGLLLLPPHFSTYFHFKLLGVLLSETQEYFLPQGARYPSYATVLYWSRNWNYPSIFESCKT